MTATADLGFAHNLSAFGDRPALFAPDPITYRDLDDRVSTVADRLGTPRRLVLLSAGNDVSTLVTYLAALRGGHPVLLAAPAQVAALTSVYDPDVVIDGELLERREGSAHELHPELALLLSTSGTTGSPKLARLSADNLAANAAAIGEYLDIRATDRAITSLPMHYCYGLSVVNSNLARGAALVLTDRSVIDPAFWDLVRSRDVTSLHGVPHTFDLLDSVCFDRMELPSLRYVTQAGGRLAPERVRRYAELGDWRFFVMYGQTEATARMAYLPPELASTNPSAIGVPIPGGHFRIDDDELVYSGPNVMLGYANGPGDLALGRTTTELRTGDLARVTPTGLYEITGRKSRFLKLFGLRIDLDQVERSLAQDGLVAACTGDDETLVVALRGDARRAHALIRARYGLPDGSVRVYRVEDIPRLPNGKVDYRAIASMRLADDANSSVREVFASVLGLREVPDDATFINLGGDSLRYVQMTVALQRLLGDVPDKWPTTPVADLERMAQPHRRVPMIDTTIVLRALAILLIVGSHVDFFRVLGGAHLLLIVAGWNFARFLLPAPPVKIARAAAFIAVPTSLWLTYRAVVTEDVTVENVLLVNNFMRVGAAGYWFVEVLVHVLVVLALLFAITPLRRWERSHHYLVALVFVGLTVVLRLGIDSTQPFFERNMTTFGAAWFVALGWLAHRSQTLWQKGIAVAVAVAMVPGRMDDAVREIVVVTGLVLLLTFVRVPVPRRLLTAMSVLAGASLSIYLTHYAVFPELLPQYPTGLVFVICIALGVGVSLAVSRCVRSAGSVLRRAAGRPAASRTRRLQFLRSYPWPYSSGGNVR